MNVYSELLELLTPERKDAPAGLFGTLTAVSPLTVTVRLGLEFKASPKLTSPLNLPAPGRRQPIYITLRFRIDLCFC